MEKTRILIVDDEFSEAGLLKRNLEQTGSYEARVEIYPDHAVQAAQEFKPHLVILDILMPHLSGGNVAAALHEDATLKDIPVVFLSGAVSKQRLWEREGILSNHPCLAKPAEFQKIVNFIEVNLNYKPKPAPFRWHMLPQEALDED